MTKYRKKPVEVEAVQFTRHSWDDIWELLKHRIRDITAWNETGGNYRLILDLWDGSELALDEGDYIVRENGCTLYACKPGIFAKTYEEVAE